MNRITELFGIRYPVVQGGMIWCSGWKLAAAVSNAGGLGLIGSGSMHPELLREHIHKCRDATKSPFGVNIPLLFGHSEAFIRICIEEQVPAVFTSAGNPVKYTKLLQENGIRVAHVVANTKGALKCTEAGVDAIVAEGFEAGGHNGREETTTLVLIPLVRRVTQLPLIAAGGIATGRGMLAAMALGADGVQIGSRFAASEESSAHPSFKQKIAEASEGDTMLSLKKLVPVRLLKNEFFRKVSELEQNGAPASELEALLAKGRAGLGMFEGDMVEGELEIGQASALIREIKPVSDIMEEIITEYRQALQMLPDHAF
ncbi:MAG TPA: nitronate monooxygenase [Bacteroidales bacterium]|nr:nitronate monooxygenase [Bacteroidales bacterium]